MDNISSELPAKIHANLGLYYSYSKQLSAYLQLNNITNSKQDLWVGYREMGFNAVFSIFLSVVFFPEFTSIATKASVVFITSDPPDSRLTFKLNNS